MVGPIYNGAYPLWLELIWRIFIVMLVNETRGSNKLAKLAVHW
jgi:hypothetical protein